MSQYRKRQLSPRARLSDSRAGSALIDVIIAVAIFGVAPPALLSALGLLVRAEARSREQILLVNLAQNQLETAKQLSYTDIAPPYPTVTPPEGYTVVASSTIPTTVESYLIGSVAWKGPTAGAISARPAVLGGAVYIGSEDFTLRSFDSATGTQL